MNELFDIFNKKEELDDDLKPFLDEDGPIGPMLKHPLIYSLICSKEMYAYCNMQYKAKKEYIKEAIERKNWSSVIWAYERPYRLEEFIKIKNQLSDSEYWKLLSDIWSDSENLWQYKPFLKILLEDKRPSKDSMMDEDELRLYNNLPDQVTIYRGHQRINRSGYSWTLSYQKALWFANRFKSKKAHVLKATISKKDIIAVLLGRNELEVIACPNKVEIVKDSDNNRPEWLNEVKILAEKEFILNHQNSCHGKWHWQTVEENAHFLTQKTPEADPIVANIFALIHDCKRENENDDPDHGVRAAKFAEKLYEEGKLPISNEQLNLLTEACKFHNDGKITDDPTIGVCWDADRLDLVRVGIMPSSDLLSTKAAKEIWSK